MPTILSVKNVSQAFHDPSGTLDVLDDVSFEVERGEFVCLVGPSGSGKSTLLRIMAGLQPLHRGSITASSSPKISMVFQNFAIFPWLTVAQNIAFGLAMNNVSRQKIDRLVAEHIHEIGLNGFEDKHPKELSGGMRQRVGIARALALSPDILFMDEPFSALDAFTAKKLRADLLQIWGHDQMTIVMVTHLVEEAVELADRIIVFSSRPGQVKEIIKNDLPRPRNTRAKEFFVYVDKLEGLIV